MDIPSPLKKFCQPHFLYWLGILIVVTLNLSELIPDTLTIEQRKKYIPFYFQGFKFSGLEEILNGIEHVGYYTDQDISLNYHLAEFAQAQYILAPVILDLNNTQHEFILFNCSSEGKAFAKIKDIGAIPLKKNKFGILLAQHKK